MLSAWKSFFRKEERRYDVALVSDLRFLGGTSSSNAQEIRIQHAAGLKTALFHVPSTLIGRRRKTISPQIQRCLDLGYADLLDSKTRVYAPVTIVRHPTVAMSKRYLPRALRTDHVVLVINHPPRSNRKVDYELATVIKNISSAFGKLPQARPIGPAVAKACLVESKDVKLGEHWYNVFEAPPAVNRSRSPSDPIIIGRHSRDGIEKWPADGDVIRKIYPDASGVRVKILGGAEAPKKILEQLPSNWQVYGFNEISVPEFLNSIDVYVYFHHPSWIEAFGRAVCEAIVAGIPTILPPSFEPLYGDACLYCEPSDVLELVRRLQHSPEWAAEVGRNGRRIMIERFGPLEHLSRLRQLGLEISATSAESLTRLAS
jgi:hypothetical protein